YNREIQDNRLSFVAFKQVPWHHFARFSIEQSQLTVRSPFLDNDLVSMAYRAPEGVTADKNFVFQMIAESDPALAEIETDRGVKWASTSLLSKCRNLWQQFTFKSEYTYDYGMPHWLAKIDNALMPMHLERLFLGRHKFYHFRLWYRDSLADDVRSVLLDE